MKSLRILPIKSRVSRGTNIPCSQTPPANRKDSEAPAKRSQHLNATCCVRLAILLRRVATCWVLKIELVRMPGRNIVERTWPDDYNIMQHPQMLHEKFDHFQIRAYNTQHVVTCRNTSQQGGQTRATCCAQQCCDMLRWNVAIVWPGLEDGSDSHRVLWASSFHFSFLLFHIKVSFSHLVADMYSLPTQARSWISILAVSEFLLVLKATNTGKVENLHGHVNCNLQYVNLDLHSL